MTKVFISKPTKTYVSITIFTKDGGTLKQTIRTIRDLKDAIAYIQDNKDVMRVVDACKALIDPKDYSDMKKLYKPTTKQVKKAIENRKARENWYAKNEKQLDREVNRMVNHPGFMGTGVTRQDVDATVSKEVQALYN